jgi:aminoglycoside phosphotransferase (APT) family kinase protein
VHHRREFDRFGPRHDGAPVSGSSVVGFDVPVVERWLATVTSIDPPIEWTRLPGGHSNLTYLLRGAAGRELVIRRPPEGQLLPKAHDMWREYRIIDGLWPTAVPVAEPIAYCDDRDVAETHFYVMGKVGGAALYTAREVTAWLDEPARQRAGESFVDVLAALHALDPVDVGLADLGRHDGYIARQLRTWYGSWTASIEAAGLDDQRVHALHALLSARIPEQGPARVVHGDYGPHNCLFARDGSVTAVLDWEIATLGDPLADFAYSINAWVEPGDPGVYGADPPTALPGFPSRAVLMERYAAATGADLSNLGYYRAFNAWKTACILHGVSARYRAGQKSTEGVDLDALYARIGLSIDAAVAHAS